MRRPPVFAGVISSAARPRRRRAATVFLLLLFLTAVVAGPAFGLERFPPPDFTETGHRPPRTVQPPPRAHLLALLDIAVLTLSLAAAAWLSLRKRSRRGLFLLALFSLAYFGFWRKGCVCPIGAIQNVALALSDARYAVPAVVLFFFILPLVFALFFGRAFCAGVCPFGALQEVVLLKPVRTPAALDHALSLLPYIYLGAGILFAATGSAFLICRYDPFVGFFRLSGSPGMLLFGAALLFLGVFVGRPYCRYLCPYGALLALLSRVSKQRVTIAPAGECVECRLCEEACPYGAILPPTPPAPASWSRDYGRGRLALLLLSIPLLAAAGGLLGAYAAAPLSRMHAAVRLADEVWEKKAKKKKPTDKSDTLAAFTASGKTEAKLFAEAATVRRRFDIGATLFGVWAGLAAALKLVSLSVRRKRTGYEADRAACMSCGRCFDYCPNELARKGLIEKPADAEIAADDLKT